MPIKATCRCGKTLQAPDSYAGKTGKCPACGGPVDVPKGDEPLMEIVEPRATPASRPNNVGLWAAVAVSLAMNVGLAAIVLAKRSESPGTPAPTAGPAVGHSEKIEVSEIVLREPGKKPSLMLKATGDEGAEIVFLQPDGSASMALKQVAVIPSIEFYATGGGTLMAMRNVSNRVAFDWFGKTGTRFMGMSGNLGGNGEFSFSDHKGVDRVLIEGPYPGIIAVKNHQGSPLWLRGDGVRNVDPEPEP